MQGKSVISNSSRSKNGRRSTSKQRLVEIVVVFLMGCAFASMVILNAGITTWEIQQLPPIQIERVPGETSHGSSVLDGLKILVAIAAFDFSQLPHLEEVLDGYFDFCPAGAKIDVVVHTTVPWPVTLIDLFNSRLKCTNPSPRSGFSLTIVVKTPVLRLHLVDCHRELFYEKIDDYDLFIYSEDDIRVTPKTVAAYLHETERVKQLVGSNRSSDFNVGVARYEYNYPPDIIINDKTRHATQNVTRVYWEHVWKPAIPKSVDAVPQEPLSNKYVHMTNHHQGMYIATRELLKAWKVRPGCEFDRVRDRPGLKNKPSQPSEGTQRVWMSSQMLYGNRHCNVQQVIPMDTFGELTVLHLPNKNYRRVGIKGRLGGGKDDSNTTVEFATGEEQFKGPSDILLTAMELHIEIYKKWPPEPQLPYQGIQMIDEVQGPRKRHRLLQQRMREFHEYVERGGILSQEDMAKTSLEGSLQH